jgi:signal peptidase II
MTTDIAANASLWRANLPRLIALVLAIVACDQVTKALVADSLGVGQSVPLIPGLVHFTLVRNTGMAFGLLAGTDIPFKAALVTLLSVLAMSAVTYYALKSPQDERLTRIGLTFILGGALGNIIDRVRWGYVVDFVDVFYGDTHWPAFNVADTCICIGVGLLLLDSVKRRDASAELASDADVAGEPGRGET